MALEYLQILLVLDDASYQRNMHNLLLLQAFSGKTKIVSTQFQFFLSQISVASQLLGGIILSTVGLD
jgi:hypothetical protein